MKLHVEDLVNDIRGRIVDSEKIEGSLTHKEQFLSDLSRAWAMWAWTRYHRDEEFIESFSLIALGLFFDNLKGLSGLPQA